MKIIGIIAEYNPFHLGHAYQIQKIKEQYPDSLIIAIISPCFTERGDISLINKWDKTEICLNNGIDLVVELPTLYSTQSADLFAYGAINILAKLGIDILAFGSESNNIDNLINLANIQINNQEYNILVKKYLEKGQSYPTAMSKALEKISGITIEKPNDLLALSYVKEIIKNNYNITPFSIQRSNDYHENKLTENKIINAQLIRNLFISGKNIEPYVPKKVSQYMYNINYKDNIFKLLKYKIFIEKDNLSTYLTVDEGIENRLIKYINFSKNLEELIQNIKTKRYTYNKINRMFIHLILSIKKEDNLKETYIRILGFNKNGQKYLNTIKKEIKNNLVTNYKPNIYPLLDLEYQATCIYSLIVNDQSLTIKEYKNKPIMN